MTLRSLWRISLAFWIAVRGHAGQKDKAGKAYIWHLVWVAWIGYGLTRDPESIVLGLLHDYLEDVDARAWGMLAGRFGFLTAQRLADLKRGLNEPYSLYINRIAVSDSMVIDTKIADLMHNTDPTRMPRELRDYETVKNRQSNYRNALSLLMTERIWR